MAGLAQNTCRGQVEGGGVGSSKCWSGWLAGAGVGDRPVPARTQMYGAGVCAGGLGGSGPVTLTARDREGSGPCTQVHQAPTPCSGSSLLGPPLHCLAPLPRGQGCTAHSPGWQQPHPFHRSQPESQCTSTASLITFRLRTSLRTKRRRIFWSVCGSALPSPSRPCACLLSTYCVQQGD